MSPPSTRSRGTACLFEHDTPPSAIALLQQSCGEFPKVMGWGGTRLYCTAKPPTPLVRSVTCSSSSTRNDGTCSSRNVLFMPRAWQASQGLPPALLHVSVAARSLPAPDTDQHSSLPAAWSNMAASLEPHTSLRASKQHATGLRCSPDEDRQALLIACWRGTHLEH